MTLLLCEIEKLKRSEAFHIEACAAHQQHIDELRAERDGLARMLADWCVRVNRVGTGWDDWDEAYKNAAYSSRETSPPSLRSLIDEAIRKADDEWATANG